MSSRGEKTQESTAHAKTLIRAEKFRLAQLECALEALNRASDRINRAKELADEAGEILIGSEVDQVQELIGKMAGEIFAARKRKTHAELDALMDEKTGREVKST